MAGGCGFQPPEPVLRKAVYRAPRAVAACRCQAIALVEGAADAVFGHRLTQQWREFRRLPRWQRLEQGRIVDADARKGKFLRSFSLDATVDKRKIALEVVFGVGDQQQVGKVAAGPVQWACRAGSKSLRRRRCRR